MPDEIGRYQIGVKDGADVPYKVVLECESLGGFENHGAANGKKKELAGRYEINPDFLEVKIRR